MRVVGTSQGKHLGGLGACAAYDVILQAGRSFWQVIRRDVSKWNGNAGKDVAGRKL